MTADTLRVGVDVRCLAEGELRGFARYTLELVDANSGETTAKQTAQIRKGYNH